MLLVEHNGRLWFKSGAVKVQYAACLLFILKWEQWSVFYFQVKEYLKVEYEKGGKPRDEPFYEKILADIFKKSDHDNDGLISAKEYNIYEHDEL